MSSNSTHILPSGFTESFALGNFFSIPVSLLIFLVYIWIVVTKRTHWLHPFSHFQVIMLSNVFLIIFWNLLPFFWPHVEGFAPLFWICYLFLMYLGLQCQILLNLVATQTFFLFFAKQERGCFGRRAWTSFSTVALTVFTTILFVTVKFSSTIRGQLMLIDVPCVFMHIAIISMLLVWLIWWKVAGKNSRFTQEHISHLVNSIVFIVVSTICLIVPTISTLSNPKQFPDTENPSTISLQLGSLYYLPFIWVLSAVISNLPAVQQFFQLSRNPKIVEFDMA